MASRSGRPRQPAARCSTPAASTQRLRATLRGVSTASAPPQPPDATSTSAPLPPAAVSPPARRRRPFAVTALAGLQLISATYFALAAAALVVDPTARQALSGAFETLGLRSGALADVEGLAAGALFAAVALLELLAAILLLRLKRIGWTITMLLTGVALAAQIFNWWNSGEVVALGLLFNVATVFYLNQRMVRQIFGITGSRIVETLEVNRG